MTSWCDAILYLYNIQYCNTPILSVDYSSLYSMVLHTNYCVYVPSCAASCSQPIDHWTRPVYKLIGDFGHSRQILFTMLRLKGGQLKRGIWMAFIIGSVLGRLLIKRVSIHMTPGALLSTAFSKETTICTDSHFPFSSRLQKISARVEAVSFSEFSNLRAVDGSQTASAWMISNPWSRSPNSNDLLS